MDNHERAQAGLKMLKEAILSEIKEHPHGVTNAEIVHRLGLESDYGGSQRNYLSWSILGILLGERKLQSTGEGKDKTYHLVSGQATSDGLNQA